MSADAMTPPDAQTAAADAAPAPQPGSPPPTLTVEEPPHPGRTRRSVKPEVVLALAAAGVFMEFVDSTIVNIAFPSIRQSFPDTTLSTLSWIFNAYSIVFAASLVVSGRLADLFGRRRLFLAGVTLFTISSALCGLAPSSNFLIAFRAVQAIGGAMVVPSSMALVIQAYPVSRRAEAATIYGATAALAAALGPPIGGLLVGIESWRLCFYVNVPIGIAVLLLSSRLLVESRAPGRRVLPDLVGAMSLAAGLGLVTLGIVRGTDWGWTNSRIAGSFGLALAVIVVFLWRSSWHRSPIVDPVLGRSRPWPAVTNSMLFAGLGFYGYLLCHALFLILVWRYSAFVAGLTFIPGAVIAAVVSALSRPIAEHKGFAWVLIPGGVAWAAGMIWYVEIVGVKPAYLSEWLPGSIVTGIGAGLVLPALGAAAIAATPGKGYAIAGALNTTARQIGGALGIALVIVIIGHNPTPASLRHGWLLACGCFVAVAVLGLRIGGLRPSDELGREDPEPRPPTDVPRSIKLRQTVERRTAPGATADAMVEFVRSVPIFAGLNTSLQQRIAEIAETVTIPSGEFVFHRDDPVDGLYVVRAGRIDVLLETSEGLLRSEVVSGDVLGELALLAEPRRTASAQARRDSELIRIPREDFEQLLLAGPELGLALSRRLARLLQSSRVPYSNARSPLPETVAIVGVGGDASALARRLEELMGGSVGRLGIDDDQANRAGMLDLAEHRHDRVLLVAAANTDESWLHFCVRQADAVVVAAFGSPPAELPAALTRCSIVVGERREVRPWARATASVADRVIAGESGTAALARRFTGRSAGLVLSGGGARALAHVGVIQELERQGVMIDRVAAAGTGSLIGAMLAMGWSGEDIAGQCFNELVRRKPFSAYRPSRTSLIGAHRVTAMLERLFGDTRIEELPLEFVCVSADLEHGQRVVHRSGVVAQAVLAAITMPGLMAPVPDGERLLVDAGTLDNLPIDVLGAEEGPIIVVDVARREQGPRRLERSRRPGARKESAPDVPAIGETLARAMVLGSCDVAESARRAADLSVLPDTAGVGPLEFYQLDVLVEAGSTAVHDALAQCVVEVGPVA